jgi:hypothetical protein
MADKLLVHTYEPIATILTKLDYNYSSLASVFEKVFYDKIPDDVEISIYNEAGELVTYTIENIAKALQNILNGEGAPEGSVPATKGSLYQDLKNGDLYIKETSEGTEGWDKFATDSFLKGVFIQGNGDPNGNVVASKGILYIDVDKASLYIKTTADGNTDWNMISASVATFAKPDLSNLSPLGEDHFANPDLSNLDEDGEAHFANPSLNNLSPTGEAKFNEKENIANKISTITASSTNAEYPSAKATRDYVASQTSKLANNRALNLLGDVTGTGDFNLSSSNVINVQTTLEGKSKEVNLLGDVTGSAILNTGNSEAVDINVSLNPSVADGQWIISPQRLSTATSKGAHLIDLSSYLPNDNYNYVVKVMYQGFREAGTTNSLISICATNAVLTSLRDVGTAQCYGSCYFDGEHAECGNIEAEVIVDTNRRFYLGIAYNETAKSYLAMVAYRRLGTNN